MTDRTPVPGDQRPPLPAFNPVPRQCRRHDGWTPERQRAFIEALADTGSVTTAARMVNMSSESAYALRRHPAGEGLRRAWRAALDMGVERLRDEAMERALNGQLVPVFSGGKLMGFRRKKNDRLLMFVLRHHRFDREGRRITINMFQANASATAGAVTDQSSPGRGGGPPAQPVVEGALGGTTRRITCTTAPAPTEDPAATIADFAAVPLDEEAQAQIVAALEANAARQRALAPEDDPAIPFVGVDEVGPYCGELEGGIVDDDLLPRKPGEARWEMLDDHAHLDEIDRAVEQVNAARKARAQAAAAPALPPPPATPPTAEPSPNPQPQPDPARVARARKPEPVRQAAQAKRDAVDAKLMGALAEAERNPPPPPTPPLTPPAESPPAPRNRSRRKPPALPAPPVGAAGERYSDSMPWLSEADRKGIDHIDAMIEAAKAEMRRQG